MGKPAWTTTQRRRILFLTAAALCTLPPTLTAQTGETPSATESGATTANA
jgi:hypothetical protein